ncbi:MAG TPA: hypothetical protein VFD22_07020, partial [Gemmatimonadaceae bacterium]|nr:hypothetical protein [Gemmatimonadaceae bacterium]
MSWPRISLISAVAVALACSDNPVRAPAPDDAIALRPRAAVNPPPAASLTIKVDVPASMRTSPFNV